MSDKSINILFIGYNVAHTGFTRVMHSIIAHLGDEFEIHYASIGLNDCTSTYNFGDNVTVHLYDKHSQFDPLRVNMAKQFLQEHSPDLVFMLNDLWCFRYYQSIFEDVKGNAKLIYYTPLDGRLAAYQYLELFEPIDCLVAFTENSKEEINRGLKQLSQMGKLKKCPSLAVIPHGVDTNRFRPLHNPPGSSDWKNNRITARQKLWDDSLAEEDAFIVLNVNRVQHRKQIELTIKGFAKFAKDKPANVKLCLHHAVLGEEEKVDLDLWIEKWNIGDRLLFSSVTHKDEYIDDTRLNLIYNACDVGVNTSIGEGWGLIAFEHAATGAAQIVPNHSACGELWKDAAILLEPVEKIQYERSPIEHARISADDLAHQLELLYQDKALLQSWSVRSYEFAVQEKFDWKFIADKWTVLFKEYATKDLKLQHV